MAGDKARLAPGMRVMGINGRLFSSRRLQDALAGSIALRKIELLLLEGDRFRTIFLDYADGPRYLVLVRDESKPDLLVQILKPIADKPQGSARRKPRSEVGLSLSRGYVAYRTAEPITINGKLDEKAWQAAPWTDAFVDIEGNLKPLPRFQTRAKMLWDDQYFYVAAHLEEPHIWGTLTKHDAVIFQDNDFEIFIDPDGDNREYYEIEINALNTEWDLFLGKLYRDGGPAVNAWEIPGLRTAVHVEGTLNDAGDKDQFWSVEFAIPWKVLAEKTSDRKKSPAFWHPTRHSAVAARHSSAGKVTSPRGGFVCQIGFTSISGSISPSSLEFIGRSQAVVSRSSSVRKAVFFLR